MDIKEIIEIGAQLFKGKVGSAGGNMKSADIVSALTGLLANKKGGIDLSSIVSNLDAGGLMNIAASWLGDGSNNSISGSQISKLFGSKKISSFASKLGLDKDTAVDGLTAAIPGIMDKSSKGGSLVSSIGGISDALGGLKGLFG